MGKKKAKAASFDDPMKVINLSLSNKLLTMDLKKHSAGKVIVFFNYGLISLEIQNLIFGTDG